MEPIFKNSVVLITGASNGIGAELARQLAAQEAHLALAARRVELLKAVVEQCQSIGGQAQSFPTDIRDRSQCAELVHQTVERFGHIDMLINNAGITMWANFENVQDLDIFGKVMETNYLGSLYCTYYALPYLKQRHGRIVVVSSLSGKTGIPSRSGYAASKHAVTGFFDSLRIELEDTGVSVTVVYPGYVATGSQARAFGTDGNPLGKNPVSVDKAMTTEECAAIILRAAARRKREEIMTLRGKMGMWLKMIAPSLVDRMAKKAVEEGS